LKLFTIWLALALFSTCQATDRNTVEKSVKVIKAQHESRLMEMPGVVSVGVGQDEEGNQVIVIGIESEAHLDELTLPEELEGFPVKYQVIGTIRAK
jgi:hypothetical protein